MFVGGTVRPTITKFFSVICSYFLFYIFVIKYCFLHNLLYKYHLNYVKFKVISISEFVTPLLVNDIVAVPVPSPLAAATAFIL